MKPVTRFIMRASLASAVTAGTLALSLAGSTPASAQDVAGELALRGYPLAIHQGTCDTLVAEPAYDLGLLRPRPLVVDEADFGAYDEGLFDDAFTTDEFYPDAEPVDLNADTPLLFDDVDDDGILDYGLDYDADGVLVEVEILQRPILWAAENELADLEGLVPDDEGAELADLRDVPHALVVHRGAITDTDYLACAEIEGPVDEEGRLVTVVKPIGQGGMTGIAEFEQADDGFLGIGGDGGAADVYLFPSRVAQTQGGATGTPVP
jgi:hypothetical protein